MAGLVAVYLQIMREPFSVFYNGLVVDSRKSDGQQFMGGGGGVLKLGGALSLL